MAGQRLIPARLQNHRWRLAAYRRKLRKVELSVRPETSPPSDRAAISVSWPALGSSAQGQAPAGHDTEIAIRQQQIRLFPDGPLGRPAQLERNSRLATWQVPAADRSGVVPGCGSMHVAAGWLTPSALRGSVAQAGTHQHSPRYRGDHGNDEQVALFWKRRTKLRCLWTSPKLRLAPRAQNRTAPANHIGRFASGVGFFP